MKKIIILTACVLLLAGCTSTKAFKKAKAQAEICEKAGFDYRLAEEGITYISDVACIPK